MSYKFSFEMLLPHGKLLEQIICNGNKCKVIRIQKIFLNCYAQDVENSVKEDGVAICIDVFPVRVMQITVPVRS